MSGLKERVEKLNFEFLEVKDFLNLQAKLEQISVLEGKSTDPGLWNDQVNAKRVLQDLADLKVEVGEIEEVESELSTLGAFSDVYPTL